MNRLSSTSNFSDTSELSIMNMDNHDGNFNDMDYDTQNFGRITANQTFDNDGNMMMANNMSPGNMQQFQNQTQSPGNMQLQSPNNMMNQNQMNQNSGTMSMSPNGPSPGLNARQVNFESPNVSVVNSPNQDDSESFDNDIDDDDLDLDLNDSPNTMNINGGRPGPASGAHNMSSPGQMSPRSPGPMSPGNTRQRSSPRTAKKSSQSGCSPMIIGLSCGALFLVAAAIVAAFFLFGGDDKKTKTVDENKKVKKNEEGNLNSEGKRGGGDGGGKTRDAGYGIDINDVASLRKSISQQQSEFENQKEENKQLKKQIFESSKSIRNLQAQTEQAKAKGDKTKKEYEAALQKLTKRWDAQREKDKKKWQNQVMEEVKKISDANNTLNIMQLTQKSNKIGKLTIRENAQKIVAQLMKISIDQVNKLSLRPGNTATFYNPDLGPGIAFQVYHSEKKDLTSTLSSDKKNNVTRLVVQLLSPTGLSKEDPNYNELAFFTDKYFKEEIVEVTDKKTGNKIYQPSYSKPTDPVSDSRLALRLQKMVSLKDSYVRNSKFSGFMFGDSENSKRFIVVESNNIYTAEENRYSDNLMVYRAANPLINTASNNDKRQANDKNYLSKFINKALQSGQKSFPYNEFRPFENINGVINLEIEQSVMPESGMDSLASFKSNTSFSSKPPAPKAKGKAKKKTKELKVEPQAFSFGINSMNLQGFEADMFQDGSEKSSDYQTVTNAMKLLKTWIWKEFAGLRDNTIDNLKWALKELGSAVSEDDVNNILGYVYKFQTSEYIMQKTRVNAGTSLGNPHPNGNDNYKLQDPFDTPQVGQLTLALNGTNVPMNKRRMYANILHMQKSRQNTDTDYHKSMKKLAYVGSDTLDHSEITQYGGSLSMRSYNDNNYILGHGVGTKDPIAQKIHGPSPSKLFWSLVEARMNTNGCSHIEYREISEDYDRRLYYRTTRVLIGGKDHGPCSLDRAILSVCQNLENENADKMVFDNYRSSYSMFDNMKIKEVVTKSGYSGFCRLIDPTFNPQFANYLMPEILNFLNETSPTTSDPNIPLLQQLVDDITHRNLSNTTFVSFTAKSDELKRLHKMDIPLMSGETAQTELLGGIPHWYLFAISAINGGQGPEEGIYIRAQDCYAKVTIRKRDTYIESPVIYDHNSVKFYSFGSSFWTPPAQKRTLAWHLAIHFQVYVDVLLPNKQFPIAIPLDHKDLQPWGRPYYISNGHYLVFGSQHLEPFRHYIQGEDNYLNSISFKTMIGEQFYAKKSGICFIPNKLETDDFGIFNEFVERSTAMKLNLMRNHIISQAESNAIVNERLSPANQVFGTDRVRVPYQYQTAIPYTYYTNQRHQWVDQPREAHFQKDINRLQEHFSIAGAISIGHQNQSFANIIPSLSSSQSVIISNQSNVLDLWHNLMIGEVGAQPKVEDVERNQREQFWYEKRYGITVKPETYYKTNTEHFSELFEITANTAYTHVIEEGLKNNANQTNRIKESEILFDHRKMLKYMSRNINEWFETKFVQFRSNLFQRRRAQLQAEIDAFNELTLNRINGYKHYGAHVRNPEAAIKAYRVDEVKFEWLLHDLKVVLLHKLGIVTRRTIFSGNFTNAFADIEDYHKNNTYQHQYVRPDQIANWVTPKQIFDSALEEQDKMMQELRRLHIRSDEFALSFSMPDALSNDAINLYPKFANYLNDNFQPKPINQIASSFNITEYSNIPIFKHNRDFNNSTGTVQGANKHIDNDSNGLNPNLPGPNFPGGFGVSHSAPTGPPPPPPPPLPTAWGMGTSRLPRGLASKAAPKNAGEVPRLS